MTAPVTVPSAPPLAHHRGVELMRIGQWNAQTGVHTFTRDDLGAAVAALDCPAVRRPVLKFGHDGQHGVGEPALGWVENMAVTEDGSTLIGDYVGMPGWFGAVLPSAFPDRSVEGDWNYACQLGHVHPFVVHAVALLGVERPAIGTLASLQGLAELYGVDLSEAAHRGDPVVLTIRAQEDNDVPNPRSITVAAGVTTEDVRRAYYDTAPWEMWIEEFHLDPLQLIVLNDNQGARVRVPITVSGDGPDGVTFGEAVPVVVRYEDAAAAVAAGAASSPIRYASRAESRPGAHSVSAAAPAAGGPAPQEGSPAVSFTDEMLTTMRQQLGLADDADEATISAAMTEALTERAEPPAVVPPAALPEGTVAIDSATLEQLQVAARRGEEARSRQEIDDRAAQVEAAITAGRIPPARREHWLGQLAADPGAAVTLAALPAGLVPVGAPMGHAAAAVEDPARKDDYWFPGVVSTSTSREG